MICPFGMAEITHAQIHGSCLFPFEKGGHGTFYDDMDSFNDCLVGFLDKTK